MSVGIHYATAYSILRNKFVWVFFKGNYFSFQWGLFSLSFKVAESTQSDTSVSSGEASKRSIHFLPNETKLDPQLQNKDLNTKEKSDPGMDEDDEEGDSFFDDPIPKPERTYGW